MTEGMSNDLSISSDAGGSNAAPTLPEFSQVVPAEYQNEAWVRDFSRAADPYKALFDGYKNAQTLIGKKSTGVEIPGEGASDDAVKSFYKALGVPESPDGYSYQAPDISGEDEKVKEYLTEAAKDDTFMKAMRAKAHESGVTPKQFQALAAAVDAWKLEDAKTTVAAAKQQGEQRQAKFKELYGDKAEYVERVAKETFAKVIPENIRSIGDSEIAMFEAMRYIHEKLFRNDSVSGGDAAPLPTKEELQAKIFKLRAEPAFRDPWHPGNKDITRRVDELYEQMLGKS